jgi:broad specificity phosphatase PhoE
MQDGWQYFVLMRHGHSYANAAVKNGSDSHYYSVSGSDETVELNDQGKREVAFAAGLLAKLFPSGNPIATIWTSSFRRVTQSADMVRKELGYPIARTMDARLDKRSYGLFWNLTYKGVEDLYPEEHKLYKAEGPLLYRPPGGENYYDLFARTDKFFSEHIQKSSKNILVLTHLAVILAFQRKTEALSDEDMYERYEESAIRNGTVFVYRRKTRSEAWQFFCQFAPDAEDVSVPAKLAAGSNCSSD